MALKSLMKVTKALSPTVDVTKPRLVTIGFSHFSEKARWALDLSPWALEYYEEVHCPALHLSSTLDIMSADRVVSWDEHSKFQAMLDARHTNKIGQVKEKTGVPKLVIPKSFLQNHSCLRIRGQVNTKDENKLSCVIGNGSSGILKALCDLFPTDLGHLYPASHFEPVIELEHMLDTKFAPAVTQWDFVNTLLSGVSFSPTAHSSNADPNDNTDTKKYFIDFLISQPVPLVEKIMFKLLGHRFILRLMIKSNLIESDTVASALDDIHSVFAQMDVLLVKNNPTGDVNSKFLLGTEKISAADIAFASFASAVLFPPQTARFFPTLSALRTNFCQRDDRACAGAQNLIALAEELTRTYLSAQYVLDLYEVQRFRTRPPGYKVYAPGDSVGVPGPVRVVEPRVR